MTRVAWLTRPSRRITQALLLGISVSVTVTALSQVGVLAGWETRAEDAILFLRDPVQSPEIVLVTIDDEAFRELGERQPIPRDYLADLGQVLLQSGARVVAFDILLKARSVSAEDAALVAMIRRWESRAPGCLVFASLAIPHRNEVRTRYDASPIFARDTRMPLGFTNALIGSDGVIRRMALTLPSEEGASLPSFALATLAAYLGHTRATLSRALSVPQGSTILLPVKDPRGRLIQAEPVSLATLSGHPWRVDFVGPSGSFVTFPSGPLVRLLRNGSSAAPDNPFRDKIVVVGATFQESKESYATPVGLMAGVEVHANMIHTILARRFLLPPPWRLTLAVSTAACLAVALLSLWLRPTLAVFWSFGLIGLLVVFSLGAYTRGGYWLDFVVPMLGMIVYLQASRFLAQRRLRGAFGQYVSPEVMKAVVRDGTDLQGEVRTVSVLMSDLRGFTRLCEQASPAYVSEMMNEYFSAMLTPIMANRGMVSDFIGDGILAFYGAPAQDAEHASHAVATALEMQAALHQLNAHWQAKGRVSLDMGIAVHSGEAFAGTIGSLRKKKYAVLGDTVNTTARIEGLNRELSTSILISGATLAAAKDRVLVRDRGSLAVRGRKHTVEVFELLGARDESSDQVQGRES